MEGLCLLRMPYFLEDHNIKKNWSYVLVLSRVGFECRLVDVKRSPIENEIVKFEIIRIVL